MKKYCVFERWNNEFYECCFGVANRWQKRHDGDNYVSRGGSEGLNLNVYDTFEEAMNQLPCNIIKVSFDVDRLNKKQCRYILKKFMEANADANIK